MNIKNSILLSLFALVFPVLVSCSDKESTPDADLVVSKGEMFFGKEASTQKLAIKTKVSWKVISSAAWCKVTPAEGEAGTKQIEVSVDRNTDTDSRKAVLTVASGSESEEVFIEQSPDYLLIIGKKSYDVPVEGGKVSVEFQSSGEPVITINDEWISKAVTGRAVENRIATFEVSPNLNIFTRTGTITLQLDDIVETITFDQSGTDLTIPADKEGMDSDAKTLAAQMKLGWNLGNSLEACSTTAAGEEMWGNPKTTQAMIDMVKSAGFNAVRIPCAWSGYIINPETYEISNTWLARVKEVVDYCVNADMYAIINIHWDGGWLEENAVPDKKEEVNRKQKALWQQIAVYFRNYNEKLLFAGTNEVHGGNNQQENFDVQMSYNQTFVDAVRSTGGKNSHRNLIVQAYQTDIDMAYNHMIMATDPTPDRQMLEVHYYSPWNFCGMEKDENWGKMFYLWGKDYAGYAATVPDLKGRESTWGDEDYLVDQFRKIKTKFVDKGYPVILGEFGAIKRTDLTGDALKYHLESRAYYNNIVTREAKNNGMVPFYWDNGNTGNNGFGIFDRKSLKVQDEQLMDALLKGSKEGKYPF